MIKKTQNFLDDVKKEMAKVSWPTHNELMNSTAIVVVVSIARHQTILLID
jgi:preprotein translocase subunit SecE